MAHSEAEAVELAARVGYPIVMKMTSKSTSHKTDVGGVRVGIADEAQLRAEYQDLLAKLEAKGLLEGLEGVIIQEMVKSKRELVTGIATDPQMGPMIMFGLGGVFVEVLKDVAFRIAPLTDIDAQELIRSVKAVKLLEGARGMIPAQMDKVEDTLLRISQLADQHRFVKELDINPLMVSDKDGEPIAVDARIAIDVDAVKAL
jgi:acetyltransferase